MAASLPRRSATSERIAVSFSRNASARVSTLA
jgi:hypothetical protein